MRMFNDLILRGDPAEMAEFTRRIDAESRGRWHRERESETRLKEMMADALGSYCFSRRDENGRAVATLWLDRTAPDHFSVSNIAPVERRSLTEEEYNGLLAEFESDFVRPMAEGLEIERRVIPPVVRLEESLDPEAIAALRSFSAAANKSALHPLDRARWNRFLVRAHRQDSTLDGPDLDWWLKGEGWPEEQRGRLVDSYEAGLSLLAKYDEERITP